MSKTILITGSSNGIGAGIAKYFGAKKWNVVVTYLKDKEKGEKVAVDVEKSGGKALLCQVDVKSEKSVKNMMSEVEKRFKVLDVLVNNAAIDYANPIETASFEDWKKITRTKIDGNFLCTKYGLPILKKSKQGNLIIVMSSMYERVDPEDSAYCVGTAGTFTFMKCMALALTKYNIRVNGVCPGECRTNNQYYIDLGDKDEMWEEFASNNPMGRVTTPLDVAKAVEMIVEDKSNFINGNEIYVNGGRHLK